MHQKQAPTISESGLQAAVIELAEPLGDRVVHQRRSRVQAGGLPDPGITANFRSLTCEVPTSRT